LETLPFTLLGCARRSSVVHLRKRPSCWLAGVEYDQNFGRIQGTRDATPAPIDEALNFMQLTSKASELFTGQPAAEQRRLRG